MQPTQPALVTIIDDDAGVRDALAWLLRSRRLPSQSYESAEAFLDDHPEPWQPQDPSCLLL
ncbi:MAG: DNA-binding response regulator, partial [Limnohabitans sp.]